MPDTEVIKQLFDKKILRIIEVFVKHRGKQFYLRELSRESGVSPATTYRILRKLVQSGFVEEIVLSKFKVYQLIINDKTKGLVKLLRDEINALDIFVKVMKDVEGIDTVILHGKKTSSTANLLLIGSEAAAARIQEVVSEIKEKYSFTIDFLILSQLQFNQMTKLGVYAGEKKTLWSKEQQKQLQD